MSAKGVPMDFVRFAWKVGGRNRLIPVLISVKMVTVC